MTGKSFFLTEISNLLNEADKALANSYRYSLCKRILSVAQEMYVRPISVIIQQAVTVQWIIAVIEAFLMWLKRSAFGICSRIYYGSVFMNAIGRAVENSRWLK